MCYYFIIMPIQEVIKYSGLKQVYDRNKVLQSLIKSGVGQAQALSVIEEVDKQLPAVVTTRDLYKAVYRTVHKHGAVDSAKIYRIREAFSKIDSIEFEKIIANLFSARNINSTWNQMVLGKCIEHQIDVIADNRLIEVKRHSNPHRETGLGDVVELWGRLLDINENPDNKFLNAVLVTNGKFSEHAKKFSMCRKIGLLGWRYNSSGLFNNNLTGLESIVEVIGKDKVLNILQNHLTE